MPAELCLDRLFGVGPGFEGKGRLFELRHHAALCEISEIAALRPARAGGLFPGQLDEVLARIQLGHHRLGLFLAVDEDMAGLHLLLRRRRRDFPVIALANRLFGQAVDDPGLEKLVVQRPVPEERDAPLKGLILAKPRVLGLLRHQLDVEQRRQRRGGPLLGGKARELRIEVGFGEGEFRLINRLAADGRDHLVFTVLGRRAEAQADGKRHQPGTPWLCSVHDQLTFSGYAADDHNVPSIADFRYATSGNRAAHHNLPNPVPGQRR